MQKWFDKAAVAAVALMLSAGLLLALPALGAYWQYRITEDAWKSRGTHRAQSRRLRSAVARPLWQLRRGQQRRLGILFRLRREFQNQHLPVVRRVAKRSVSAVL